MIALKLMVNKWLRWLKRRICLIQKLWKEIKIIVYDLCRFDSILVPEDNEQQNQDKSSTSKYKKHITCSYGYKLVCVDDKFTKTFKSNLG